MAFKDLSGQTFDRLKVICLDEEKTKEKKKTYWKCECECGNTTSTRTDWLTSKRAKSCGCLRSEIIKEHSFKETHGMWGTKFYKTWDSMIGRCHRENDTAYDRYGALGIQVCDEWRIFENFYNDMYDSYEKHLKRYGKKDTTIERIDPNGNYCKDNCTWKTNIEQCYNKRNTVYVDIDGELLTLKDISDRFNIDMTKLKSRNDYIKRKKKELNKENLLGGLV